MNTDKPDCQRCPVSTGTHKPADALHEIVEPAAPTESALIDGTVYETPARVAGELMRRHIELLEKSTPGLDGFAAAMADALATSTGITRDGQRVDPASIHAAPAVAPARALIPDEKPLPELMMASYHEAIGWNACRAAMIAAQAAPAAAAGPAAWPAAWREALEDALSVTRSVSVSRDRRVVRDGCVLYLQTEEWCKWVEDEVGPKIAALLDAAPAAQAAPAAVAGPSDEECAEAFYDLCGMHVWGEDAHKTMVEKMRKWGTRFAAAPQPPAESQEPVASVQKLVGRAPSIAWRQRDIAMLPDGTPLYTHPAPQQAAPHAPAAPIEMSGSFVEWFTKNYPRDTIIVDPAWHAQSIFRMAQAHARLSAVAAPAAPVDATRGTDRQNIKEQARLLMQEFYARNAPREPLHCEFATELHGVPVKFEMVGPRLGFKIGNQGFVLDFEPTQACEFEAMREMLLRALGVIASAAHAGNDGTGLLLQDIGKALGLLPGMQFKAHILPAIERLKSDLALREVHIAGLLASGGNLSRLVDELRPDAERFRAMVAPDIERAAKILAELFDYPWDHMPSEVREAMRKGVRVLLAAARVPAKEGGAA